MMISSTTSSMNTVLRPQSDVQFGFVGRFKRNKNEGSDVEGREKKNKLPVNVPQNKSPFMRATKFALIPLAVLSAGVSSYINPPVNTALANDDKIEFYDRIHDAASEVERTQAIEDFLFERGFEFTASAETLEKNLRQDVYEAVREIFIAVDVEHNNFVSLDLYGLLNDESLSEEQVARLNSNIQRGLRNDDLSDPQVLFELWFDSVGEDVIATSGYRTILSDRIGSTVENLDRTHLAYTTAQNVLAAAVLLSGLGVAMSFTPVGRRKPEGENLDQQA